MILLILGSSRTGRHLKLSSCHEASRWDTSNGFLVMEGERRKSRFLLIELLVPARMVVHVDGLRRQQFQRFFGHFAAAHLDVVAGRFHFLQALPRHLQLALQLPLLTQTGATKRTTQCRVARDS